MHEHSARFIERKNANQIRYYLRNGKYPEWVIGYYSLTFILFKTTGAIHRAAVFERHIF